MNTSCSLLLGILSRLAPLAVLGTLTLRNTGEAGSAAVDRSREALDAKAKGALELRAVETANHIAGFLREREADLRKGSLLPRTSQSYLAFSYALRGELWLREDGREVRRQAPLFREMAFIDGSGREVLKIIDGRVANPEELRDVNDPTNTTYKNESSNKSKSGSRLITPPARGLHSASPSVSRPESRGAIWMTF